MCIITRCLTEKEKDETLNESSDSNMEDSVNLERVFETPVEDISDCDTIAATIGN